MGTRLSALYCCLMNHSKQYLKTTMIHYFASFCGLAGDSSAGSPGLTQVAALAARRSKVASAPARSRPPWSGTSWCSSRGLSSSNRLDWLPCMGLRMVFKRTKSRCTSTYGASVYTMCAGNPLPKAGHVAKTSAGCTGGSAPAPRRERWQRGQSRIPTSMPDQ